MEKETQLYRWLMLILVSAMSVACTLSVQTTPAVTAIQPPASTTATPTPDLDSATAYGEIISFTLTPVEALSPDWRQIGPGDTIAISWKAHGSDVMLEVDNAGISFGDGQQNLPLEGTIEWTLRDTDPVADHWADVRLTAHGEINHDVQTIRIYVRCHYQWFQAGLSNWCPAHWIDEQTAIAQNFEQGVMFSRLANQITVLFDSGVYRDYYWAYGYSPDADPDISTLEPPSGFFAPENLFAALWVGTYDGTEDLQEQLGWATGLTYEFTWTSQCEKTPDEVASLCYTTFPSGEVFTVEDMTHQSPDSTQKEKPVVNEGVYHIVSK